ncbi:hypothetical protein [Parasulfuritortus cantonensis]|nr:hypothetical protein [Parasulfuritortus cantonensis]
MKLLPDLILNGGLIALTIDVAGLFGEIITSLLGKVALALAFGS